MEDKLFTGLNDEQVKQRIRNEQTNKNIESISKTYKEIFKSNLYTFFNLINIVLAALVFITGHYENMLFMGVVLSNLCIGVIQEIRAKRTLDKMALIIASKVKSLRSGQLVEIYIEDIVVDDILLLASGQQIVCDCILIEGELEVDESLISGESDTVLKQKNDNLYSGSFVVSNEAYVQVMHVASDNYSTKLMHEAKLMKRYHSQLKKNMDQIIKIVTYLIVPFGIFMFLKTYFIHGVDFHTTILNTCAAIIGMIPEGLVILVSIALSVSTIHLAKKRVLVQELYCLDMLARVDTLCFDKTGTLTTGVMQVSKTISEDEQSLNEIIANFIAYSKDANATMIAIKKQFTGNATFTLTKFIPFSSSRKYSALICGNETYYMGAYSFIVPKHKEEDVALIETYATQGYRVISVAKETNIGCTLVGIICLEEEIRNNAKDTITYFKKQGVNIKIISGDDPISVKELANRVGVEDSHSYIDLSTVNTPLDSSMLSYTVYGRVNPQQKRELILLLKKHGHCVGMSGDGINDVLAFKEADVSIAMASGSDMARRSANMVLLDDNFDALPDVLYEGRRVINNIQRVATLFLAKTLLSFFLILIAMTTAYNYPFEPIHLTFMSTICIGVPGFLFALEGNKKRIESGFLENIVMVSLPSALSAVACLVYLFITQKNYSMTNELIVQLSLVAICLNGIFVLIRVARPFSLWRIVVTSVMSIGMLVGFIYFTPFLGFEVLQWEQVNSFLLVFIAFLIILYFIFRYIIKMIYPYIIKQ